MIKDTFNKYPNRFLLYYDERWNCKLFFNYRTVEDNEENIISRLSNELKVKKEDIVVEFVTDGKKFYWMTLSDVEKDVDIREKNMELVDIVKASIG